MPLFKSVLCCIKTNSKSDTQKSEITPTIDQIENKSTLNERPQLKFADPIEQIEDNNVGNDGDSDYQQKSESTSGKYNEEPCAIQFVETSTNYENIEIPNEDDELDSTLKSPIGFRNLTNNNYLSCVLQSIFACKKYVNTMLDFGIHIEKTKRNYFPAYLRLTLQMLDERKKTDLQRYLAINQNCISQYPYMSSISNCFLSIFYKIEDKKLTAGESLKCIEESSDTETTNEFERFIEDNFYGRMATTEICKDCDNITTRYCHFVRLIPIMTKKYSANVTLSECIDDYFTETTFTDESVICYCENNSHEFIKKQTFIKSPEYLIVCVDDDIKEDDEDAEDRKCVAIICDKFVYIGVNMERVKYQLISVIDRMGTSQRCYSKCCFDDEQNDWWLISDEMVTPLNDDNFSQIVTDKSISFVLKKC